jgi:hypothetical protein
MPSDFVNTVDQFERRVGAIEVPKLVLADICRTALGLVDFICIMKLKGETAHGWIADCRQSLPGDAIDTFVLSAEEVPAIRVVLTTRIPMSMKHLNVEPVLKMLRARHVAPPQPCTVFPLGIGDKIPFIIYMDRATELDASEIGQLTRLSLAASLQFTKLIVHGRGSDQRPDSSPDKRPNRPRITRLMTSNWASEYKTSDKRERKTGVAPESLPKAIDLDLEIRDIKELQPKGDAEDP